MPDTTGACTEPELTDEVPLCAPDGRLDRAAVGWARRPVHDCALPGSWGRRKRWDFWGLTGPGSALNVVVADVDYVGIADVWFHDFASGATAERSVPVPLARGMALPDTVAGGDLRFSGRGLDLTIAEEAGGTRLTTAFDAAGEGVDGGAFSADVLVRRPEGHESLSVVIPWSDRRFQCTTKDVGRPAAGTITWGDRRYVLSDGTSWGTLDFGRGKWPYRTRWNWGAGAGVVARPGGTDATTTVGVQLGGRWTAGTGMTENALVVDGRLSKISEELVWTYDTTDWLRPWTIRTPGSDRVDLTFTPFHDKRTRLQLGVAAQATDQCFGTYAGTVVPDAGGPLTVDGLVGWAEEAAWRW